MKKLFSYLWITGAIFACASCSTETNLTQDDEEMTVIMPEQITGETPYKSISLGNNAEAKVSRSNQFAIELFKEIADVDSYNNTCYSPLTSITGLAMLANTEDGPARKEILEKLGYKSDEQGLADLTDFCRVMMHELPILDKQTSFLPANSLWLNTGLKAGKAYAATINDIFRAEIFTTDLFSDEGMDAINKWCALKTNNLIDRFLSQPANCEAALFSALYFNGIWTSPFDKEHTFEGYFDNTIGKESKVMYMNQVLENVSYYADSNLKAASLDYGNGNFRMTFILPKESKSGIMQAVSDFTNADYNNINSLSEKRVLTLSIPRFEARTKLYHTDIYKKLGFKEIFESGLSGILENMKDKLYVKNIIHETVLKVTEDGAEAASVNGNLMVTDSGEDWIEDNKFKLDRPFIYIIEETSTHTILFMGCVANL